MVSAVYVPFAILSISPDPSSMWSMPHLCRISLFILVFFIWVSKSVAFDAGYHFDQTRDAAVTVGFGEKTAKILVLSNWLVDFHSTVGSRDRRVRPASAMLNFDGLDNTREVTTQYRRLLVNLKRRVQLLAREGRLLDLLVTIGAGTHAVQDFYAHTNWVPQVRLQSNLLRLKLFQSIGSVSEQALFSGEFPGRGNRRHGNFRSGLNKDSLARPGFAAAYIHSTEATKQLLAQVRTWVEDVEPALWNVLLTFSLPPNEHAVIDAELEAAKQVSMNTVVVVLGLPLIDGVWKGNLSGSVPRFNRAFSKFGLLGESSVTARFRKGGLLPPLVSGRYIDDPMPTPPVAIKPDSYLSVSVEEYRLQNPYRSFQASVSVNGERYVSRILRNQPTYVGTEIPATLEIFPFKENMQVVVDLYASRLGGALEPLERLVSEMPELGQEMRFIAGNKTNAILRLRHIEVISPNP